MGERKVINKYFPPDFDHTKIPRPDKEKQQKIKERFVVRMMLPMSVRCLTCGEYMYKGKKFNSRKENVGGPEGQYLGIQIIRFYFKCVTCSAEFTVKTDPQNSDYVVEAGAKANFELYKEEAKEKAELAAERADGEQYDAMKKLENKTEESKRAMDILDALDEIRTQNARSAALGVDDLLDRRQKALDEKVAAAESELAREDELEAQRAFATARVKRLRDEDEDEDEEASWPTTAGMSNGISGISGSTSGVTVGSGSGSGGSGSGGSSAVGRLGSSAVVVGGAKGAASKRPKLPIGVVVQPKAVPKPAAAAPVPLTPVAAAVASSSDSSGAPAPQVAVTTSPAATAAAASATGATAATSSDGNGAALLGLVDYDSSSNDSTKS